jgi:hypothetical protein
MRRHCSANHASRRSDLSRASEGPSWQRCSLQPLGPAICRPCVPMPIAPTVPRSGTTGACALLLVFVLLSLRADDRTQWCLEIGSRKVGSSAVCDRVICSVFHVQLLIWLRESHLTTPLCAYNAFVRRGDARAASGDHACSDHAWRVAGVRCITAARLRDSARQL